MNHRFSLLLTITFCLIVCLTATSAQDNSGSVINRGVLNGSAIQLPKPVYPEASRLAAAGGVVVVNVVIDELGNVISAKAIPNKYAADATQPTGEPLASTPIDAALIEAAEDAARAAKFAPTHLNGVPVRVRGIITYNFLDPDTFPNKVPVTVASPVLNEKAGQLPSPVYPPAAVAVKAQGLVSVQVSVDEAGNVISASAVSGHPLLRSAAAAAAREAKFSPTFVSGEAVRVNGLITYNFVLPNKVNK